MAIVLCSRGKVFANFQNENLALYAIRNLLKKLKNPRDCLAKIRDNLAKGKSAKLFLVSLSQQFTAGGPEALHITYKNILRSPRFFANENFAARVRTC